MPRYRSGYQSKILNEKYLYYGKVANFESASLNMLYARMLVVHRKQMLQINRHLKHEICLNNEYFERILDI